MLFASLALMTSGCVTRERVVYMQGPPPGANQEVVVNSAPPPVYVETVTAAPGPGYVWVGGSWVWSGRWVWAPGRWSYPPHANAVWVSSRYRYHHGNYVYVRGYWRY